MQRIETFFLRGPAGRLECQFKRPVPERPEGPVAILCHPHPLFGGTMNNKVVHTAAEALGRCGFAVLRFNFRGAGASGGRHDGGRGEQEDLRAVLDHLAGRCPRAPVLVAGYSFGAWVGLRVGCADERVSGLIGIAAPAGLFDFRFLRECTKPLAFVQGESDVLAPLDLVLALAAALPNGARVLPVPAADHGFADRLDELAERVAQAVPEPFRAEATAPVV